jgi:hypothetical protein
MQDEPNRGRETMSDNETKHTNHKFVPSRGWEAGINGGLARSFAAAVAGD